MLEDCYFFFFFKQKTAYEMRISDWSSDVCSSDLPKVLIKLQPILVDIILQELIEEWGCRFGRLALTTIDSSFIKDHRSVLVRLQHAERIHRTILGVDIPVTISLLIAGEDRKSVV